MRLAKNRSTDQYWGDKAGSNGYRLRANGAEGREEEGRKDEAKEERVEKMMEKKVRVGKSFMLIAILVTMLATGVLVGGCTMGDPYADAKKVFKEYKKAEIEIENFQDVEVDPDYRMNAYEKIQLYTTDQGYDQLLSNGALDLAILTSLLQRGNITLEKINYDQVVQDDRHLIFDYTLEYRLTYPDGRPDQVREVRGQAKMYETNEGWKVNGDWRGIPEP